MTALRTSVTHPLEIATLNLPEGGAIGVTFCPGKRQACAMTGAWARDLGADLERIRAWGAMAVITLTTETELAELGVPELGEEVRRVRLEWYPLPIPDMAAPSPAWEARWQAVAPAIHRSLSSSARVVVHCKGGLGRAGTVAARLLMDRGVAPSAAIETVRRVRPGAIETRAQETYLHNAPVGSFSTPWIEGPSRSGV